MLERILNILQGEILQPLPPLTSGLGGRIAIAVDILLVTVLLTVLFRFLRRTRATNILWGFLLIGLGIVAARLLNLTTVNLLLTVFFALLLFTIPFIFQPELRRGLERLGRRGLFRANGLSTLDEKTLREITETVDTFCNRRYGALIALENHTGLSEYVDTGVPINSEVRSPLLETIFTPGSPLHDGAIIIRDGKIAAAACTLPLASEEKPGKLGTRHRAALGLTEDTDALAIVVSEESGAISLAVDGRMFKVASPEQLAKLIRKYTRTNPSNK